MMSGNLQFETNSQKRAGETIQKLRNRFSERKHKWWDWHKKNPHVWDYFKKYSDLARESGKTKCSAWLIVNRIRWEVEIVTFGGEFKISNDYIAFYARWYNTLYPKFFNTKPFKEERLIEECLSTNIRLQ